MCASQPSLYYGLAHTHSLCISCLGAEHARSALEGAGCAHCEQLHLRMLCSHMAVFDVSGQAHATHGSGPVSAESSSEELDVLSIEAGYL